MTLQEWIRQINNDRNEFPHRQSVDQAVFIRDCLHPLLVHKYDERKAKPVLLVGEHSSKSVKLPVAQIIADDLTVTMRCNWYDWKFSVKSDSGVADRWPKSLFVRDKKISPVYCEGFPEELVYGPLTESLYEFTVETPGSPSYPDYTNGMAFAFCLILGDQWHNRF